jgi:hypothetical protein
MVELTKKEDSIRERAIEQIVFRLLENIKKTVKENNVHNITYHGNWYTNA